MLLSGLPMTLDIYKFSTLRKCFPLRLNGISQLPSLCFLLFSQTMIMASQSIPTQETKPQASNSKIGCVTFFGSDSSTS